jgi:hypothetical protein
MLVEEVGGVEGAVLISVSTASGGGECVVDRRRDLLPLLSFRFKMNMIFLTWAAVDHWLSVECSDVVVMIDRWME